MFSHVCATHGDREEKSRPVQASDFCSISWAKCFFVLLNPYAMSSSQFGKTAYPSTQGQLSLNQRQILSPWQVDRSTLITAIYPPDQVLDGTAIELDRLSIVPVFMGWFIYCYRMDRSTDHQCTAFDIMSRPHLSNASWWLTSLRLIVVDYWILCFTLVSFKETCLEHRNATIQFSNTMQVHSPFYLPLKLYVFINATHPKSTWSFFSNLDHLSFPFQMNQMCKVCGEPAAGFHFGAFTCEGCKVR